MSWKGTQPVKNNEDRISKTHGMQQRNKQNFFWHGTEAEDPSKEIIIEYSAKIRYKGHSFK